MTEFVMRADAKMMEFFSRIADEMQQRFSISHAEAVARLNEAWGGLDFEPYPDLVCHETPEHWAYQLYYGDVAYWDADADRSSWQPTPPPPADSPAWTIR